MSLDDKQQYTKRFGVLASYKKGSPSPEPETPYEPPLLPRRINTQKIYDFGGHKNIHYLYPNDFYIESIHRVIMDINIVSTATDEVIDKIDFHKKEQIVKDLGLAEIRVKDDQVTYYVPIDIIRFEKSIPDKNREYRVINTKTNKVIATISERDGDCIIGHLLKEE